MTTRQDETRTTAVAPAVTGTQIDAPATAEGIRRQRPPTRRDQDDVAERRRTRRGRAAAAAARVGGVASLVVVLLGAQALPASAEAASAMLAAHSAHGSAGPVTSGPAW